MSQTELRRYLDDQAATVVVPPDLADGVRRRATTRRRTRAVGVAAVLAAVLALGAALGPTLLRSTQAEVVDSPADGRAVVPRTIPPLGGDLPRLGERAVERVSVAWTAYDPDPTAKASGRLLGLDASDGQPVVLIPHQVNANAPVVVSPDGRSVAYVLQECQNSYGEPDRQSLGVLTLDRPLTTTTVGQCSISMRDAGSRSRTAAWPAYAWSADSQQLSAIVDLPTGRRAIVYRMGPDGPVGRPQVLPGAAAGVAARPGGWAVRRADGSWDLVSDDGRRVTPLTTGVTSNGLDARPAQMLAWSPSGQEWAQVAAAPSRLVYRLADWPEAATGTRGPVASPTGIVGVFVQQVRPADRWIATSGPRFVALAGPVTSSGGGGSQALGVPEGTPLARVVQAVSRSSNAGSPVSLMAFTGASGDSPDQDVYAVGVAGDLLVDPHWVPTVPDDGHRSWVQVAGWVGLAVLGLLGLLGLLGAVAVVRLVGRRRPTLT